MTTKIGENIAFFRKKKELTQDELAKILKVSNQAVSKWEAGKCCPDIELLPELARFFGVSIDELLLGECLVKTKSMDEVNDPIMLQAIRIVQEDQVVSTSKLQRKLQIGYSRAKKIIDDMCKSGYIVEDTTCSFRYLYNSDLSEQPSFAKEKE